MYYHPTYVVNKNLPGMFSCIILTGHKLVKKLLLFKPILVLHTYGCNNSKTVEFWYIHVQGCVVYGICHANVAWVTINCFKCPLIQLLASGAVRYNASEWTFHIESFPMKK